MEIEDSIYFGNAETQTSREKPQAHTYNYGKLELQRHAIASQHGVHLIVGAFPMSN